MEFNTKSKVAIGFVIKIVEVKNESVSSNSVFINVNDNAVVSYKFDNLNCKKDDKVQIKYYGDLEVEDKYWIFAIDKV